MRLAPDLVDALRAALTAAGHTVDGVFALLGPDAHAALSRNETVPARRATADGSPLSTLVRLFQLQLAVPRDAADRALPGLVDPLVAGGLLHSSAGEVRAAVDVRPYGDEDHDWWVVCDLTPGLDAGPVRVGAEHVLGISEASSSLAHLTVRTPVARALDLGTGCGVQALHLAQHADRVVATDVNPRALAMAELTASLNGVTVDVRRGSLFEPVATERFDLVATNPPFVVSPPDGDRLVYRETGFEGDEVVRRIVQGAPDHLTEHGWCQVLASWIHPADQDWADRLSGWIAPTGLDAWVVQREVLDPASYAEMWLADAGHRGGPGYVDRYDAWLGWFEARGIEAMGFGWITLRRSDRDVPHVRVEECSAPVAPPVGPGAVEWAGVSEALAAGAPLDRTWRTPVDLVQDTHGAVGAADPERIVVRRQFGLQRSRQVDTVEAALLSASDGDLTAGQILDAVASLLDLDPAAVREQYAPAVESLAAELFLLP
ncbi:methyltransferase small domain protein [Aeromicrobium marinum DSM 15272]|uniref:Methyltransferase small domain protein n=1 Tax=Aeromicrobium marinum DSM 15272 TaxID=585531 RepID=E2SFI9_9ACTN|nr:methyltransferase [Aeromicrobium marinum]EFQ82090.1 methyltransferase small domain protein [Aeromicrobium marinum DSM 15272]